MCKHNTKCSRGVEFFSPPHVTRAQTHRSEVPDRRQRQWARQQLCRPGHYSALGDVALGEEMLLSYKICSCTSEDGDHPVRELQEFHSQSRGWQSARWCEFPQAHQAGLALRCLSNPTPSYNTLVVLGSP